MHNSCICQVTSATVPQILNDTFHRQRIYPGAQIATRNTTHVNRNPRLRMHDKWHNRDLEATFNIEKAVLETRLP